MNIRILYQDMSRDGEVLLLDVLLPPRPQADVVQQTEGVGVCTEEPGLSLLSPPPDHQVEPHPRPGGPHLLQELLAVAGDQVAVRAVEPLAGGEVWQGGEDGGEEVEAGPEQDSSVVLRLVQPSHQAEAHQPHLGHPDELQLGGGREVQGGEDDGGGGLEERHLQSLLQEGLDERRGNVDNDGGRVQPPQPPQLRPDVLALQDRQLDGVSLSPGLEAGYELLHLEDPGVVTEQGHLLPLARHLPHHALHGPGELLPAGAEVEAEGLAGRLQPRHQRAGEEGQLPGGEHGRYYRVRLGQPRQYIASYELKTIKCEEIRDLGLWRL